MSTRHTHFRLLLFQDGHAAFRGWEERTREGAGDCHSAGPLEVTEPGSVAAVLRVEEWGGNW